MTLRELPLYTGSGGGLLGTLLLGWRPIGYVENDDYCQRVIARRIADGILPVAPIFGDVREFIQSGAAAEYRGFADVVSGGFPCQPFSVAGKQRGADDPRNMWPATAECVRIIRPRFCFFENVAGLLSSGYFGQIVADLAACGYGVRWRVLSAAELGAPHKRDRLWICAYTQSERTRGVSIRPGQSCQATTDIDGLGEDVPDATNNGSERRAGGERANKNASRSRRNHSGRSNSDGGSKDVAYTDSGRSERAQYEICPRRNIPELGGEMGNTTSERLSDGQYKTLGRIAQGHTFQQPQRPTWWATEPDVGRVAHGVASRVDRIRAAGNGQVPTVVAAAWHLLTADLFE